MAFDYDLFVIGGGSGGVRSARIAAGEVGAKVALAEEYRYGGTCVIRGCVPKKLMYFASRYAPIIQEARAYGWDTARATFFDWPTFRTRLHRELDRLEAIYRRLLKEAGVQCFDQRATISGPHEVTLADGRKISAKTILLAVGGRPQKPSIQGAELGITSNDIFHLEQMPKSVLIVGGGYIASEFAGILNGLGVKTTQFYRGAQILRGFDNEACKIITDGMRASGVDLQTGVNAATLEQKNGQIAVTTTKGETLSFDKVLFATGRRPNTDDLGLEAAGITTHKNGAVQVDAFSQTSASSVYAVGDVTDRVTLTPVAIREGMAFVDTVFRGIPTCVDHSKIPSAVFTQPEYGMVGLSEEDAAQQEKIEVYATTFKPMHTSFIEQDNTVMFKLVVSQSSRKVLGVHIVADGAAEMIQLAGIAIKMGATKEDFDRICAVHPTMAEELVTMKNPVRKT